MTDQSPSHSFTDEQAASAGLHPVLERLREDYRLAQACPGSRCDPHHGHGSGPGLRGRRRRRHPRTGTGGSGLICQHVDVPVIGLWKEGREGVFITPPRHRRGCRWEPDRGAGRHSATRPDGLSLAQTVEGLPTGPPEVLVMADCGSLTMPRPHRTQGSTSWGPPWRATPGATQDRGPRPRARRPGRRYCGDSARRRRRVHTPRRRRPPWSMVPSPSSSVPRSLTRPLSRRGSQVPCPALEEGVTGRARRTASFRGLLLM